MSVSVNSDLEIASVCMLRNKNELTAGAFIGKKRWGWY
jgi:hypothetical protein